MTPDVSLYKVYVKCRLWLEMYELYLQTGKNISFHQFGEGSPASVTLDNSHFYTFYISTRFNKTFVDELNCRIQVQLTKEELEKVITICDNPDRLR